MSSMEAQHDIEDRELVGATAKREIMRQYGDASAFARATGISRRTLDRVFAGFATVSEGTLDLLEGKLGLPRDTFTLIAAHDLAALADIGVEADLIRWIRSEVE